jgi:hypothetical protein
LTDSLLSDNNGISVFIRCNGRLLGFDFAQQSPLLPNRAVKHQLKFPSGDVVQVVFAVQPTSICADMLTIYAVRLALAHTVLDSSSDKDMGVEVLQTVVVIGVTVMSHKAVLWGDCKIFCVNGVPV